MLAVLPLLAMLTWSIWEARNRYLYERIQVVPSYIGRNRYMFNLLVMCNLSMEVVCNVVVFYLFRNGKSLHYISINKM